MISLINYLIKLDKAQELTLFQAKLSDSQYKLLNKLVSFMQGNAITNDLPTSNFYSYRYVHQEKKEDDERLNALTRVTQYENDHVMRALSVNHGYFIKSETSPHNQKDVILSKYIHSMDSDILKLTIK